MNLSRRNLLHAGAGVVAGLTLAGCGLGPRTRELGDLSDLDRATFAGHTGTRFVLHTGGETEAPQTLSLVAVKDLTTEANRSRGEVFSLVFQGDPVRPFAQGVYRLEHADLGDLHLLVVPTMPRGEALFYEALFNRQVG